MTSTRVLTQKRLKKLAAVSVLVFCLLLLNLYFTSDLYFPQWTPLETTSCYYESEDDILPSAESVRFSPSSQSIFFHETSCRGGLDSRQACVVEAAARAHLNWEIHVLFAAPVKSYQGTMKTLQQFDNIHFARIHISEYAMGTPLESFITGGGLNKTRWRVSHTSDILRYTTLYKWGGVYLDLDAVVVKPFDSLKRNWAARESETTVAAGALSFSRDLIGRTVADMAIRDLADNFRGDLWGHNGPGVITRVLKEMCSIEDASLMTSENCQGFEVYGPELFYPVTWQDALYYFKPGILDFPGPYVYHVWNRVTHGTPVLEDSRYANLAKKYCPTIYMTHTEDFGVKPRTVKYIRYT